MRSLGRPSSKEQRDLTMVSPDSAIQKERCFLPSFVTLIGRQYRGQHSSLR
ncbi:hypothetical protein LRP88_11072 [Fusarium phalaenopsidis]